MLVFAGSALPVVNHGITEINVVRAQNDGVVDEAVVHFGCVDFHSSLADQHVAFQIDTFERTEYAGPSRRSSVQTGEYAVCVVVQKSQVYVFGTNHQVEASLGGGTDSDVSVHTGHAAVGRVCHACVQENCIFLLLPTTVQVHFAQISLVESEVPYMEVGIHFGAFHQVGCVGPSGGLSGKIHGVEINDVEDVFQIDVFQIDRQGIARVARYVTVENQVTVTLFDGESVDVDQARRGMYAGGMYVPDRVVDDDLRGMKFDVGEHLLFFVSGKPGVGRDGTLIDFFGVVGPIQSCVDIVMGGAGQQSEVHGGFADLLFEIDGTGEGIVDTAGQNPYVVQLLPVVVERRDGRIEVQFLGTAVEITVDVSGFRDLQWDAENLFNRLRMVDVHVQGHFVRRVFFKLRCFDERRDIGMEQFPAVGD